MSGASSYTNRGSRAITRVFPPICALDYQTLQQQEFELNNTVEIPRDFTHICQNGKRVFMVQGGRLMVGDFSTMLFPNYVEIGFSVLFMEPLGDGAILMSNKGIHFVDGNLRLQNVNCSELKSFNVKASSNGGNAVFGINDEEEVFSCVMVFPEAGSPYPATIPLSGNIDAVKWGDNPKIQYCGGKLFVARDTDIYVFRNRAWTRYDFGTHSIRSLGEHNGRLVIHFFNSPMVYDIPIIDTTEIEETPLS